MIHLIHHLTIIKLPTHPPTLPNTRPPNPTVPRKPLPRPPTPRYSQNSRKDRSLGRTSSQAALSWDLSTSYPPEKPLSALPDIVDQLATVRSIIDISAAVWDDAGCIWLLWMTDALEGRDSRGFMPIPTHGRRWRLSPFIFPFCHHFSILYSPSRPFVSLLAPTGG
jgi:hypothetical protein